MSAAEDFLDTNILIYLIGSDTEKADRAEALLAQGATISVQVLNEFVSVAMRKAGLTIVEARDMLATVRALCDIVPLDVATHDLGLDIASKHSFSLYDSMIVAAATRAKCKRLWSEDMQTGRKIEGVEIRNPFG
jgi:predicted nucleic acid-binding protein